MSKKRSRQSRARRRRQRRRHADSACDSATRSVAPVNEDVDAKTRAEQHDGEPSITTLAIRLAGIAPFALLVVVLASLDLYPKPLPQWVQPVADKQIAVLTLTAGHAGIIGLLISTKGRFTFSTFALVIAATATALAGFRTIGDSTSGQAIAAMLVLLTIPAVFAESLSAKLHQVWKMGTFSKRYLYHLAYCGYNWDSP